MLRSARHRMLGRLLSIARGRGSRGRSSEPKDGRRGKDAPPRTGAQRIRCTRPANASRAHWSGITLGLDIPERIGTRFREPRRSRRAAGRVPPRPPHRSAANLPAPAEPHLGGRSFLGFSSRWSQLKIRRCRICVWLVWIGRGLSAFSVYLERMVVPLTCPQVSAILDFVRDAGSTDPMTR